MQDQISPLHRLSRIQEGKDGSVDKEDITGIADTSGCYCEKEVDKFEDSNVFSLTSLPLMLCQMVSLNETGDDINTKSDFPDTFSESLLDLSMGEMGSLCRLTRSKGLRSRSSHGYLVKPLNSLEGFLTAQSLKEHAKMEEYAYSSLPSPCLLTVRPLLVTDGSQIISRGSRDFRGEMCLEGRENKVQEGGDLEENGMHSGAPQVLEIGLLEVSKSKQNICNKQYGRLSRSSTRESGQPFHSQGSSNGTLLFFLGITIGIISIIVANQVEMENLN